MIMGGLPLALVLFLLFLAATLWAGGRAWRRESGLPEGSVIYTDTGAWRANNDVLHAAGLRLVGKPDYLVEQSDGTIIPVEVKSSAAPDSPWEGQVLQLAAYCLLVEENYGVRPPFGILQYRDGAFAIDYTEELEADLLDLLDEMRAASADPDPEPDHADPRRCAGCGVRGACDYRLDE
ncbi:PD-(D/E)XK nuclease family protein [Promineifilum sp.]|uniref:CRISPR-associated protein Cas4 n=1 Tax=Promineifilum sp. TaxID=2664178 RepID=UPI0035B06B2B